MRRFWAIRHPDNDAFLARFTPGEQRWVADEREALAFADASTALFAIDGVLDGRGIAVECTVLA